MNERIKQLKEQAEFFGNRYALPDEFAEQFADLIIQEHINLLRNEWYALNNAPAIAGESPRDIGIRVGKKSEIISLLEKIKQHFGVEE